MRGGEKRTRLKTPLLPAPLQPITPINTQVRTLCPHCDLALGWRIPRLTHRVRPRAEFRNQLLSGLFYLQRRFRFRVAHPRSPCSVSTFSSLGAGNSLPSFSPGSPGQRSCTPCPHAQGSWVPIPAPPPGRHPFLRAPPPPATTAGNPLPLPAPRAPSPSNSPSVGSPCRGPASPAPAPSTTPLPRGEPGSQA